MNETYTIAMEIKSETYFGKGLFLTDIFIIMIWWFIFSNFEGMISPVLSLPYNIVNVLIPLFLTRKSGTNPGKRIGEAVLFYALSFVRKSYHYEGRIPENEIAYIEQK